MRMRAVGTLKTLTRREQDTMQGMNGQNEQVEHVMEIRSHLMRGAKSITGRSSDENFISFGHMERLLAILRDPKAFLLYSVGITLLLLASAITFWVFSGMEPSWKANYDSQLLLKEARDNCERMAKEDFPSYWSEELIQSTNWVFNEKTGGCFAEEFSFTGRDHPEKFAHVRIFDIINDKELALLVFGCTGSPDRPCSSTKQFLQVLEETFGPEYRKSLEEALPSWEDGYGKAP